MDVLEQQTGAVTEEKASCEDVVTDPEHSPLGRHSLVLTRPGNCGTSVGHLWDISVPSVSLSALTVAHKLCICVQAFGGKCWFRDTAPVSLSGGHSALYSPLSHSVLTLF